MTLRFGEVVRAGNSTARVKNYYSANGLVVLMDVSGDFKAGTTIVGDDSGTSLTLSNFVISDPYDLYYEDNTLFEIIDDLVSIDTGELVAIDEYFTGDESQDYQTDGLVTQ